MSATGISTHPTGLSTHSWFEVRSASCVVAFCWLSMGSSYYGNNRITFPPGKGSRILEQRGFDVLPKLIEAVAFFGADPENVLGRKAPARGDFGAAFDLLRMAEPVD